MLWKLGCPACKVILFSTKSFINYFPFTKKKCLGDKVIFFRYFGELYLSINNYYQKVQPVGFQGEKKITQVTHNFKLYLSK